MEVNYIVKLSFKFVGGSLSATAIVTNLSVLGVNAEKDYIKVKTDFSTFGFGGIEFSSLDDLIEYLKKLISGLFVACKLDPDNKSIPGRLRAVKIALNKAQVLKIRARKNKNSVLRKLERLRESSRKKYANLGFDIDWKSREDVKAYEEELWKKAHSKGETSITYRNQDIFDKIVMKSGVFNYVFRVKDFSNEHETVIYSEFARLNLNDNGLELVFSGGVGRREFVSFLEKNSEKKIENLFRKIELLNYICNDSADKLGYGRNRKFYIDSANEDGFEFKRYGSSSVTFKINEKDLVASVSSCAADEEQKFDMTKLDDLEALVGEMQECSRKQEESSANLVDDDNKKYDFDPSEVVLE